MLVLKRFILIILLFSGFISAKTQEIEFKPKIDFFSFPNFELNTDEVTDIKVDNQGYVWIISLSSIHKYNGSTFQKISTNNVNHGSFIRFQQDPKGRIYVIDYLSNIFFIERNTLVPFKHNQLLREQNESGSIPTYKFTKNGALHISNQTTGYFLLKEDSLLDKNNLPFRARFALDIGEKTPFILITNNSFLSEEKIFFALMNSDKSIVDSVQIKHNANVSEHHCMIRKKNGNYLYSTGRGLLIEFNHKEIIRKTKYPDKIIRLFIDNSNGLWISTKDNGIHYYRDGNVEYSERIIYFNNSLAFVSDQDYQGGIWFYSEKKGLGYMTSHELAFSSQKNCKISLAEDSLFYSHGSQIWKYSQIKNNSHLFYKIDSKLKVQTLYYDQVENRLFLSYGTEGKFIKNKSLKSITTSNFEKLRFTDISSFKSINDKQKNTILINSKSYHYLLNETYNEFSLSPRYPSVIKKITFHNDTIWSTCTNGIYFHSKHSDSIEYLGKTDPLAKNYANDLVIYDDKKFFSFPNKGIYYYDKSEFTTVQFKGSPLLNCRFVVENDTTLWAISESGCFSIKKTKNRYNVKAYHPLALFSIDQLESNTDYLYLTTNNGELARIRFNAIRTSPINQPLLYIKEVVTTDSTYSSPISLEVKLNYSSRNIQFNFEGIDYKNLNQVYRYKLKGNEESNEWFETVSKEVNFASLPAGNYTFWVQSKFGLGEWNTPQKVSFVIATPYWQENWFIFAVILITLLIVSQIIAYRYKVIFREQRLKLSRLQSEQNALRALMTPHYFFNFVSSLQYLILDESREKASRFLELFSSSMRNILHQSDSKYISIEKELKFIAEYLEMERFRMDGLFDYHINTEKDIDQSELIPPFMIQPFVENAIKHGIANNETNGLVTLSFNNYDKYLKVTIEDNGGGIKRDTASIKRKSFGISLIKKRLAIHNQSEKGVEIIDLFDDNHTPCGIKVEVFIRRVKDS